MCVVANVPIDKGWFGILTKPILLIGVCLVLLAMLFTHNYPGVGAQRKDFFRVSILCASSHTTFYGRGVALHKKIVRIFLSGFRAGRKDHETRIEG